MKVNFYNYSTVEPWMGKGGGAANLTPPRKDFFLENQGGFFIFPFPFFLKKNTDVLV